MKRLEGKNTVITGAASGVGRAASLLFAREGAAVACVDIDSDMGEETAAMVRAEGGDAVFKEHHAKAREHEVKRAIIERMGLRVGGVEVHRYVVPLVMLPRLGQHQI